MIGYIAVCISSPVNNVGQKVIMLESIVGIHFLIIDRKRPGIDTTLLEKQKWKIYARRMPDNNNKTQFGNTAKNS